MCACPRHRRPHAAAAAAAAAAAVHGIDGRSERARDLVWRARVPVCLLRLEKGAVSQAKCQEKGFRV
jgi:hypothetical protein